MKTRSLGVGKFVICVLLIAILAWFVPYAMRFADGSPHNQLTWWLWTAAYTAIMISPGLIVWSIIFARRAFRRRTHRVRHSIIAISALIFSLPISLLYMFFLLFDFFPLRFHPYIHSPDEIATTLLPHVFFFGAWLLKGLMAPKAPLASQAETA